MSEKFTQDFYTSRRNYNDGDTRIGQKDRLWYDSSTNTIRISDGVTPGGIIVSADSAGGGTAISIFDNGTEIDSNLKSLNFVGNEFTVSGDNDGNISIGLALPIQIFDGGHPDSDYSVGFSIDAGGVI